jgi:electron transfer flavoprotein beta subunit
VKILVCVKQVAVLGDEVGFTADSLRVDPDFLEWAPNEWDLAAVEEALRIREAAGEGSVVVTTFGDESSDEVLRRALAMGADRAVRAETAAVGHPDPLGVASALAAVARREAPDLVLCGVQSSDSVQAATGVMLAELLDVARVAVVVRVECDPARRRAVVHRELEGGLLDVVEVDLPALLTIQTGINEPRYATLRAIKQARGVEIEVVTLDPPPARAYEVLRMFPPERGDGPESLGADPAQVAARIAELVRGRLS